MADTAQDFRDASALLDDPDGLRRQLAADGYLFFPQLLDRERVLAARADVLAALGSHGWLCEGSDPQDALPGPERRNFGDENWWDGYAAILALESFNRLPHEAPLKDLARTILGDDPLVQPMKIARVTYPGSKFPTNPHQDFFFVRGASDTLTSWIPLGECPVELGGLQVLPGSHVEGLRAVEQRFGSGHISAKVDDDDPRWTAPHHYQPGDVLVFHSLTVHRAPANEGDRLRLSGDFRFQSAQDPIVAQALFPHSYGASLKIPAWGQLSRDWSTGAWIEVPDQLRIAPLRTDPDAVPESRLLATSSLTPGT